MNPGDVAIAELPKTATPVALINPNWLILFVPMKKLAALLLAILVLAEPMLTFKPADLFIIKLEPLADGVTVTNPADETEKALTPFS